MRGGKLATIRLSPKDCMAVVDILSKLGTSTVNLSFSQAAKIVFASALESFRQSGMIPERTGFEYLNMMEPFEQQGYAARGGQLKLTERNSMESFQAPSLVDSGERKKRMVRYEELMFKYKADEINFSTEERQELAELLPEFS